MLQGMSYGVFGLGNRQYEHFAAVGKKIHRLLADMGATAVVRRGDGDDDADIDADFDAWCTDMFAALDKSSVVRKNKVGRRMLGWLPWEVPHGGPVGARHTFLSGRGLVSSWHWAEGQQGPGAVCVCGGGYV